MPTYTYQCNQCSHTYDALQSITAEAHSTCPECGSEIHRLIGSGAGIVFKGSGFYVTDYKSKGSDGSEKTESKNESSNAKDSSKSSSDNTSSSPGSSSATGGKASGGSSTN